VAVSVIVAVLDCKRQLHQELKCKMFQMGDIKLYMANMLTLSVTTFTNIEMGLKIVLLLVTIGYTVNKWLELKKSKK
jgi:hypothetical protein